MSLVHEVQAAAIDSNTSLPTLLRKAKALSVKLDISDISDWLNHEMNGYDGIGSEQLPEYRVLLGRPRFWNPQLGNYYPLGSKILAEQHTLSIGCFRESVASLDSLISGGGGGGGGGGFIYLDYSARTQNWIQQNSNLNGMPASLQFPRAAVVSILDTVRNRVLDWSLELEKIGVLGDGLTFSEEDKERASTINNTNITNINGNVTDSQIQQDSDNSTQA